MCRWLAYSGTPVPLDELLYRADNSLIDQSMHAKLGAEPTNGDGFGVGWYSSDLPDNEPTLFRCPGPAWNDANLRELSHSVCSPLFLAHVRASTGTPVQQTNCHPFRYKRWLWLHNGAIRRFSVVKRDLTLAVDPSLFKYIAGSTDSELMFYLALTFGLQDEPVPAVERMVGFVEAVGHRHGVPYPIQLTIAVADGARVWGFRYSSEGKSRSLFFSTEVGTLREMYPQNPILYRVSEETRIIVSEPLSELRGAWQPVPESSYGIVQEGADEMNAFRPRPPQ